MMLMRRLYPFLLIAIAGGRPSANPDHHQVLVLGGGVAGIIAARSLHTKGVDDFVIIEGRDELGGRMRSHNFGGTTVEVGANWIQGTQVPGGPANPILDLAIKHSLKTRANDWFGSITTYDSKGATDYLDVFKASVDHFSNLTVLAGTRVDKKLVDVTGRTGYSLIAPRKTDDHSRASEYYQFDWEYAQTPEESSLIAAVWGNNFTYNTDEGGFSDDNQMSIDQRGFKYLIQQEAQEFIKPGNLMLNATVKSISYSNSGVTVTLTDGKKVTGSYAICTFSLGVLQNNRVEFQPPLPAFKVEAIQSMTMATYTKVFLRFPKKFWFDTEMALYADAERGRYPVWQSLDHPNFFPGSRILFVTVTGDYSLRIEHLSDSQVKSEIMGVLRTMFPNVTVPEPTDFFFQRWNDDPLYHGSYSNWPPSFFSEHHDNLRANVGNLYFAGEATSTKYFGFLHGAYFEGLAIGQMVAGCIHGEGCVGLKQVNDIINLHPYEIPDGTSG